MFIMRFHRLIQSRLLWLFFLAIVVVSFVFWGAMSNSDASTPQIARLRAPVGSIRGEPVTFLQFDMTRRILAGQAGSRVPADVLDELTWNRLSLLDFASQCGLEVPIDLARRQFLLNFTNEDGSSNPQLLQNFRLGLRREGLSEQDYIRFTRDSIVLDFLQRGLGSYIMATPFEAERWARLQTDRFEIVYAPITDELLKEVPAPTEEQLVKTHEEGKERFAIPEQRSVRYLALPFETPEDSEAAAQARKLAEDTAMSYSVRLTPRRGRTALSLESLANETSLPIHSIGPFHSRDLLPGIQNPRGFTRAAFELEDTPIARNSPPVSGTNTVYVLQLAEIIPSRPSELNEVRDDVLRAATAELRQQAIATLASNLVAEIKTGIHSGGSFAELAQARGLQVTTPPAFQLKDAATLMGTLPPGLPQAASEMGAGEVFGPVESMFGGLHIGQVLSRVPVPEDSAELASSLRSQIERGLISRGFFQLFDSLVLRPGREVLDRSTPDGENEAVN